MNIFKWLFKKYQAYKDRKFKERLERVLKTHSIESSLVLKGNIIISGTLYYYMCINDEKSINELRL